MPKNLIYSIRFPFTPRRSGEDSNWKTDLLYESYDYKIRQPQEGTGGFPSYYREFFLHIQNAIAIAFVDMNQLLNKTFSMPEIRMQRFPTPPVMTHDFSNSAFVAILFLLSFNYNFVNTVRFITIEKETQLKETMKIMGLSNWIHYLSWFIRSIVILLIDVIIITIFLTVLHCFMCVFFPYNKINVIFFLFRSQYLQIRPFIRIPNSCVC